MVERRLDIVVAAKDAASGTIGRIHAAISKIGGAVSGFAGHVAGLFGHVKNLVTSPLGLLGMAGGIAGVEEALRRSVGSAVDFGKASLQLSRITGMNITEASRLTAVLGKYGIDAATAATVIGKLEKNVG